ncbi:thioredoxin reductase TR1 [Yasminevirus sp. GU-2018]|uniref:Thioredoxin reductase TR1 n=1 Tax=Yasminevirus sp. GU-2018 TaxID=2420051 RepID=A0A5K0U867_9VIRU|nr:thioredoxin reductase TR1 [Yasminevirus sp. GU-2018]
MSTSNTDMKGEYDYDVVVIGGGSGGLAHAKHAKKLDPTIKVLVFDYVSPSKMGTTWKLGGTCVNVGCIPKKLMHHVGQTMGSFHSINEYGVDVNASFKWNTMISSINSYIKSLNWSYRKQLTGAGVDYINARASFVDSHTVKYSVNDVEKTLTSKNFVIATGGRPNYGEYPGSELCLTSDDLFWLKNHPGVKILVVGGGYISLECANFLSEMGCEVTVLYRSKLLKEFDEQCVEQVAELMERRGVKFVKGEPRSFSKADNGIRIEVKTDDTKIDDPVFDNVILAIGRVPCTDGLGLDDLKIKKIKKKIVVDLHNRTTVANIYAIGDVTTYVPEHSLVPGRTAYSVKHKKLCTIVEAFNDNSTHNNADDKYLVKLFDETTTDLVFYSDLLFATSSHPELTPVAIKSGILLAEELFGKNREDANNTKKGTLPEWIPTTVFTTPEYACVGLSENCANELYGDENVEVWCSRFGPIENLMTHPSYSSTRSEQFTGRNLWARRTAFGNGVYWDETCYNTDDYSSVYFGDDKDTIWKIESIDEKNLTCVLKSDEGTKHAYLSQLSPAGETAEYEHQRYVKSDHLCKIITMKDTGRVLGVHFVGKNAGDVIQGFALACASNPNLNKKDFDDLVAIHPIVAEEFLVLDVSRSSNRNFLKKEGCGGGSC